MQPIFLLGAGASRDANLPTIVKMTEKYYENLPYYLGEDEIEAVEILKMVIEKSDTNKDIEELLTLLKNFEDNHYKELIMSKYIELRDFDFSLTNDIVLKTQKFIRDELEAFSSDSTSYLSPLLGLMKEYPYEIFTLNYDGILDIFCERNKIEYADGFSPYWNPDAFNDSDLKIKIYRLHGCLYWFKIPSGKNVKVPIIGLDLNKNKYVSSEKLMEMLIYPSRNKDKFTQIYSWLNNKFIECLGKCNLLIVVGYSFRDNDINHIIKEALRSNELWVLIISPSASSIKQTNFNSTNEEEFSRVLTINEGFRDSLLHGRLYHYLEDLKKNIEEEKINLKEQYQNNSLNRKWEKVLWRYSRLGCQDRLSYLEHKLKEILFNSQREVQDYFQKNTQQHRIYQ